MYGRVTRGVSPLVYLSIYKEEVEDMCNNKIVPIKHVWECNWCNEYIARHNRPNVYYDPMYGEDLYDPNHPEYSKIVKHYVCDDCWTSSLYVSIANKVEEPAYSME
jgi:ribosomal protein L37AE/L43A